MKISISWVFDHIDGDWKSIDIQDLVKKLNKTTVEIESFRKISLDLNHFLIANVKTIEEENIILYCPEINKEIELPKRTSIKNGASYLIFKNEHNFRWAQLNDLGSEKELTLPEIFMEEKLQSGKWKDSFEDTDYILELDNIAITHRPDLWGHRGFAREIAAILNIPLKPVENLISKKVVNNFDRAYLQSNPNNPFYSAIENPEICKRFASFYINSIENKPSLLWMINRLAKVDSKPINVIVDTTNYVMFDLSQPMHAFDATKIKNKNLTVRLAKESEELTLLDNELIKLTNKDLIISDSQGPISLAGIMGGKYSEVDENTKSIVLESANFDAASIRKSSQRFKKRTESSTRFEKSLDPNQNIIAIERFLKILHDSSINMHVSESIISLGKETKEKVINIKHDFIQKRLGVELQLNFVVKTLKKLEFGVIQKDLSSYEILIPTFRGSKDVFLPEDIIEEIGRYFGYDNIPFVLPTKPTNTNNLNPIMVERKAKLSMAQSCQMHEVQNYPFYDEEFLKELNWTPADSISVINPVSENWKQLVTSLVPHLMKNVKHNLTKSDDLRFFEWNRIWLPNNSDEKFVEKKSLAGIFFNQKKSINFYEAKNNLNNLFEIIDISINWSKPENINSPWYDKNQTADLIYEDKKIGIAGKISTDFLSKIVPGDLTAQALSKFDAFIFEIDADFLLAYKPEIKKFKPLAKYPSVWLDISFFVSLKLTVDELSKIISKADSRIYKVELIDSFEKDEWGNKKSLTIRYYIVDEEKTMTKQEIDESMDNVKKALEKIGAQLR